MIFLPGTDQQIKFFLNIVDLNDKNLLIIGGGTIEIAEIISDLKTIEIIIIADDYDSLINMRYNLEKSAYKNIKIRMMDFDNTDFKKESFDLIYAQGSVSGTGRNKIIKETKRILKSGGTFCAGEIISLKEIPPAFVKNIWQSSDLLPIENNELEKYYNERGFIITEQKDLSYTLKDFYRQSSKLSAKSADDLSEDEKIYHKKLLKKISHESNAYLKLGADDYMGYRVLIMRKK